MRVNDPHALIYMAMSILSSRDPDKGLLPELYYILKPEDILKLVKCLGGQKIKIPTPREFYLDILASLYVYYSIVEKHSDDWFLIKFEINGNEMRWIKDRASHWIQSVDPDEMDLLLSIKDTRANHEEKF
jgi:hypothetical protein